jgi:hypothetical protein
MFLDRKFEIELWLSLEICLGACVHQGQEKNGDYIHVSPLQRL